MWGSPIVEDDGFAPEAVRRVRPRGVPPYEIYFERALAEYRELAGDFQDYAEFPIEVQNAVNYRAHQIKAEQEREKRVERA